MHWLKDILPKLAGLLKLQDPDSIKLELVVLLRDYPDFRYDYLCCNLFPDNYRIVTCVFLLCEHVCALLTVNIMFRHG